MKKRFRITAIIVAIAILFASCATSKTFTVNQKNLRGEVMLQEQIYAEPYGVFNQNNKNDSVKYKVSAGNVILSVLLLETVVVPVVLVGWFLFDPKHPK